MSRKRQLKTTIFIACEGKNTERIYFEAIGEEIADHFAVTVYPDESIEDPTTHALGLIAEAKSRINDFDEVWAVFDKDGYTKHAETFHEAASPVNGKTVNIAFSSIAFEQWILLHFVRSRVAYPKSRDIIEQLHRNHYFDGYEKTAYQETYSLLKNKTTFALENAAWLRHQLYINHILPSTAVYNVNPYTDVDTLVKRLLHINEEVSWISIGQKIIINNLAFTITISSDNTLTVTVSNNSEQTIVYNPANSANHFYLLNEAREKTFLTLGATISLSPGETKTFDLTAVSPLIGMHLNLVEGTKRIMMAV